MTLPCTPVASRLRRGDSPSAADSSQACYRQESRPCRVRFPDAVLQQMYSGVYVSKNVNTSDAGPGMSRS